MFTINEKCLNEKCNKMPCFNYEGQTQRLYCKEHKLENMIDVSCKYFFENNKILTAFTDKEKLAHEFSEKLNDNIKDKMIINF